MSDLRTDLAVALATKEEYHKAMLILAQERDDLRLLFRYMADQGYDADSMAYAAEKPWKYAEVLIEAKAALAKELTP